jgi:hypothetical protein
MARKTITYVEKGEGRDKGKTYLITEMDAESAEDWAAHAIFVLMNANVEIPDELVASGAAGIASIGLKALTKVPYEAAKPLFSRMMECVSFIPSEGTTRPLFPGDIEEVSTRFKLRKEIFMLHFSFFINGAASSTP